MKGTLTTLLLFLTTLFGCTKQHVVEVDTTYDTQWTPQINIIGNNYHRVELLLDMPPRKTLYRNITDFKIQYRRSGTVFYSVLATLPFDRWSAPQGHVFYGTEHSLTEDSNYAFRMVVSYTDSTQRVSPDTLVRIPIIRGRIIRLIRAALPSGWPSGFGYANGFFYILDEHYLVELDTLTESHVFLSDSLYPENRSSYYSIVAVDGQTMYIVEPTLSQIASVTVKRFGLSPFRLLGYFNVATPSGGTIVDISYHRGALYGLWRFTSVSDQQITRHDPITGTTLESYPRVFLNTGMYRSLYSDGTNLWAMFSASYDNRFSRLDIETMNVLEEHRNPIYSTSKNCTWDGPDLWVFDYQDYAFVKIHPEGL